MSENGRADKGDILACAKREIRPFEHPRVGTVYIQNMNMQEVIDSDGDSKYQIACCLVTEEGDRWFSLDENNLAQIGTLDSRFTLPLIDEINKMHAFGGSEDEDIEGN